MAQQNHFNLKRFSNYLKYNFTMYGKTYLYFGVGLIIALFCIQFFTLSTASNTVDFLNGYYIPTFFMLYALASVLIIGTSFPSLRASNKISDFLQLPVSTFEKYLTEFLIKIVCFNVIFYLLFWLIFKFSYAFYKFFEWKNLLKIESLEIFSIFKSLSRVYPKIVVVFSVFSVMCFLFMGATYFKKNALFKTILSFSLLALFFFILMVTFSHLFLPEHVEGINIRTFSRRINENFTSVVLYISLIGVFSSLFFLPIAYYKLKEKQV